MKRIRNGLLRFLPPRAAARRFGAWQVELTTRCPLRCRMCVRNAGAEWRHADMDFELFSRLSGSFPEVETVVLEGWGEPLLYPRLLDAVRLVKAAGARAGFITSGWGLDERMAEALIDAGTDFIGVSLSGATPGVHDAIRVKSDLAGVLRSVRTLADLKARRGARHPALHAVFLMVRDNLREIPLLPRVVADMGAEAVALIQLVLVTSAWQDEQKLYHCSEGAAPEIREAVEMAREESARLGLAFGASALDPDPVPVCGEDPLRNLYISVDGQVSPCVYLNPPLVGDFTKHFCGVSLTAPRRTFGNPASLGLDAVWDAPDYRAFRDAFARRKSGARNRAFALSWSGDAGKPGRFASLPPPPEPCRSCPRMLGF